MKLLTLTAASLAAVVAQVTRDNRGPRTVCFQEGENRPDEDISAVVFWQIQQLQDCQAELLTCDAIECPETVVVQECALDLSSNRAEEGPFLFDAADVDPSYEVDKRVHGDVVEEPAGNFQMNDGFVTYTSRKFIIDGSIQISISSSDQIQNEFGLPIKNFEISFDFKTSEDKTSLFSIESYAEGASGHDRHIYLEDGYLRHRVWPGAHFQDETTQFNDNQWHSLSLRVETGQPIITTVDGVRLLDDTSIDQSNFDWANTIILGQSADLGEGYNYKGSMKNVIYKSLTY